MAFSGDTRTRHQVDPERYDASARAVALRISLSVR